MKRPITVVTGFLGSGKTTLLSRFLDGTDGVAVLVNEFGEVGLDHHLLRRVNERTVLLGSGCVCCTRRDDLVESLLDLMAMERKGEIERLHRVVVETTGLADPAPILFTVFEHPVLRHHFEVDRVITTADAVNGELHLDRNPESVKQVAAADNVVITKTDLSTEPEVRRLESRLRSINPSACFVHSEGNIPSVFDGETAVREPIYAPVTSHTETTESVSLTFDGAVDWAAFGVWLSMLLHARGEDVLRVKGILDVGDEGPVVLNGVQHIIHPPQHLDGWPDGEQESRIVFITRGVAAGEILRSLEAFATLIGASPQPLSGRESSSSQLTSRPG